MRETTWLAADAPTIKGMAEDLLEDNSKAPIRISVKGIRPANIYVYTVNDSYRRYLMRNFSTQIESNGVRRASLYYCPVSIDRMSRYGWNISSLMTPSLGFYDSEAAVALMCGLDEYGLLKSAVVGLHTRFLFADGYRPIHGAVISLDGRGIVIVGHHGAGKSTALLNLASRLKGYPGLRVLTDDWSVASESNDGSIEVYSMERRMSLSTLLSDENPEMNLNRLFYSHREYGIDKVWADIDDVLWKGAYAAQAKLSEILVFTPDINSALISDISAEEVTRLLVDSAYHMPDENVEVVKVMHEFWHKHLKNHRCLCINNRHDLRKKDDIYSTIINYLKRC
ncbi:MAG: hypothetical protein KQJ78_25435 [Deltaproteobacteria bacterium]|nr:hypothetical protein [Deltaproteobacteria bacterium]